MMSEPCVKQFTFCNTNNMVQYYQWHAIAHVRNDDHARSAVAAQYKYYEWQHNIQPIYTYR